MATKNSTSSKSSTAKSTSASADKTNKSAMNRFKDEVASELGVNLKNNSSLTAKQAGSVGGEMVRRMVKKSSDSMK